MNISEKTQAIYQAILKYQAATNRQYRERYAMRAIHLNYHEITKDPRVLKQCESLAARGVDVTVVCALEDNALPVDKFGSIYIHRMNWKDAGALTLADILGYKSMARSYPFIKSRYKDIVTANIVENLHDELRENFCDSEGKFSIVEYKKYKGLKRILKKIESQYLLRKFKNTCRKKGILDYINNSLLDVESSLDLSQYFILNNYKKTSFLKKVILKKQKRNVSKLFQALSILFDVNLRRLRIEGPADLVHAHDIYTLPAGVALAKKLGAKLIYDAHEYEIERASQMPTEGNAMADALERDCLEHVDALITVSKGLCDLYAKRYSRRRPVLVMNAPEVSLESLKRRPADEERVAFRKFLGVVADTPLIMYTGGVQRKHRGLDKVSEALALLPGFHLVVLGQRHERDDHWLLEEATKAGVRDRIHLLDPVPHQEVVPMVSLGDVSIVPLQDATVSYRHSMPNKLFEAVFSGLPVCVADLPDMREFVETHGRGKAMDPTDPKEIADTIAMLYNDRLSYKLSDEDLEILIRDFGWDAQVDKIEALYNELGCRACDHPKT